jgi:hypothetical protein
MLCNNDAMPNNESSRVMKVLVKVKRIFKRKNSADARDFVIATRMGLIKIKELVASTISVILENLLAVFNFFRVVWIVSFSLSFAL